MSDDFLSYGASALHFGLRTFSTLLQIGYKQDFKAHRVTKEHKEKFAARKQQVQDAFRREMNLIVDSPSGPGNTLSGNVARKAFENPIKFAQIVGVSTMLVSNLDVIWRVLAASHPINADKFGLFCLETLDLYMSEVGWFNIPPTLHKILVHGKDIVKACPVPIGWTSEESSEANNKFVRKYLSHHTRKTSHSDTMSDLFHRLLQVSDPCLVTKSFKQLKKKHSNKLTPEMAELLQIPEQSNQEESSSNCDSESDG